MHQSSRTNLIHDAAAPKPTPWPALWLLRLLALGGLSVAGNLSWLVMQTEGAVGCGTGLLDCNEVLQSEWSSWFGVPVSVPATSLFATVLVCMFFVGPRSPERIRQFSWTLSLPLALMAMGAAAWFISLQFIVIRSFCLYCLGVHTCGLGLGLLVLRFHPPLEYRRVLFSMGLAGIGLLVAGQILSPEKQTYQIDHYAAHDPGDGEEVQTTLLPDVGNGGPQDELIDFPDLGDQSTNEGTLSSGSDPTPAGQTRLITILNGRAKIDVFARPLLGSRDAQHVLIELFDYTCPHCRQMHEHLSSARKRYGDQFAIVPLAMPLNPKCNRFMQREVKKHQDSCELARLSIAVWRTDPSAFPDFHDWMFASSEPRNIDDAQTYANSLVDPDDLALEQDHWIIDEQLRSNVDLYGRADTGSIPKLFFRNFVVRGNMKMEEELFDLIEKELGIEALGE